MKSEIYNKVSILSKNHKVFSYYAAEITVLLNQSVNLFNILIKISSEIKKLKE